MKDSGMSIFERKEKSSLKLSFLSSEQMATDMDDLVKHYNTDMSNADLKETRKILSRVSSITEERLD